MKSDLVDIAGELRGESKSGLAYLFFDGARMVYLPKSLCEWDPDEKTMALPEWLAEDRELI